MRQLASPIGAKWSRLLPSNSTIQPPLDCAADRCEGASAASPTSSAAAITDQGFMMTSSRICAGVLGGALRRRLAKGGCTRKARALALPARSFRGAAQRRTRNPASRKWIPGSRAPLAPRNDKEDLSLPPLQSGAGAHGFPAVELALHQLAELLRGRTLHHHAGLGEAVAYARLSDDRVDRRVELGDDRRGDAMRHEHAVPGGDVVARQQAGLDRRRHV